MRAGNTVVRIGLGLCCGVFAADAVLAQEYPVKAIRLIVGQTAGGGSDLLARSVGQKLNAAWGQPVLVDNRPGAAGAIGTEIVLRASPDGYTLLFSSSGPIVINPSLYPKLGYDPVKELAPLCFVASAPLLLVVHPSVPVATVKELIALSKARSGRLNYGSGGSGSPPHLAAELFDSMANVKMTHIPFKGSGPSVAAVVAGQVDLTFATILATLPQVSANRLRALAVTTPARSKRVPEIPTVSEAGLPGYEAQQWYGLFGQAALPKEIAAKLFAEMKRIVSHPDLHARFAADGAEPGNLSGEQFAAYIRDDAARWTKVVRESGAKPE